MVQRVMTCLLTGVLSLVPILCQGQSRASRSVDSNKNQRTLEHQLKATGSAGSGARTAVPEKYIGTWVLDKEATGKEIADHAPAKVKDRWLKGAGELVRWEWAISADTILTTITTKTRMGRVGSPEREKYQVKFKEEGPEDTVVSIVQYGGSPRENEAFHLHLVEDGSLRLRMSTATGWGDDDYVTRFFVYRKETGEARATGGRGTNRAVAYLDALKACTPGEFHFSYPGLGDFRNTVVGKEGERCGVKIVHSRMNMVCSFSDETIALLTSAKKYEEARKGVLAGSTDSVESARMNQECRVK